MNEIELVLYTAVFTSVLTTLFAIVLKRFDSKEAENNRQKNEEISRLNRQYEVKTTLRNKYEDFFKAYKVFESWNAKLLNLKEKAPIELSDEYLALKGNMDILIDLYFSELKNPYKKYIKANAKFINFIFDSLDKNSEKNPTLENRENQIRIRNKVKNEFYKTFIKHSSQYTFTDIKERT